MAPTAYCGNSQRVIPCQVNMRREFYSLRDVERRPVLCICDENFIVQRLLMWVSAENNSGFGLTR